jgi:hypothetical protein
MRNPALPNREIHLDFHTSELIPGVGEKFEPGEFANRFKEAGVTGVCLFTRGHHGWCYYPTEVGEQHPNQQTNDLLGKQYKALQEVGIVPSLYTTVCWDELQASRHQDWLCIRADGTIMKMDPLSGAALSPFQPGWRFLCWNSPYREYVKAQSMEVVALHPDADYLFVDILFNDEPCCCPHCIERMKAHGLDPEKKEDREKNSLDSAREFMEFLNEGVHQVVPEMPTFYNSRLRVTGEIAKGSKPELDYLGVTIVESLPSGPWGYDHFPLFARYFQNFQNKMMGHTGKFQKMWGDFGGLKNQVALDYEVIRMMAFGVVASIGDQLPPNGRLDGATYRLIGRSYNKVKDVEKHLIGSRPIDEIGVLLTTDEKRVFAGGFDAEYGAMKMLTQLQYQFSFIDSEADFSLYKVLVLPDSITVDANLKVLLEAYLSKGGKILATNKSGLDENGQWVLGTLPIEISGEYPYTPYYTYPTGQLLEQKGIEDTDHVQYLGGTQVKVIGAVSVLAKITEPYFNRRWNHFCSHLQTPPDKRTDNPEMLFNQKDFVYFASKKFSCYNNFSARCDRDMVDYGLHLLLDKGKMVRSNLPSTAEVTVRKSAINEKGIVITVMNYIPQRRTAGIDIVEDMIPLHTVEFAILVDREIVSVKNAATDESISFTLVGGRVCFTLLSIEGYAVILLE